MKKTLLVSSLLAALGIHSAVAQQTSYPLVCRGGGAMFLTTTAAGHLSLRFNAAAHGAGHAVPDDGHCAWLDRGFREGEPQTLLLSGEGREDALHIVSAVLQTQTFYAHVYNDGRGHMVITQVGP